MKWMALVAGLLLFCAGSFGFFYGDKVLSAGAEERAQAVFEFDIKSDDGSKIVIRKGAVLSYEIRYAVTPGTFVSELRASAEGGLSSPKYQVVSHWSNGRPQVGGDHKRIQLVAERAGPATVTITYREGRSDTLVKKLFTLDVQ